MLDAKAPIGARMEVMSGITHEEIAAMAPADRLVLIGDLWDSLDDADLALTAAQSAELARRLDAFEADQSRGVAWDDLKAELEKRCP
jgi:putative addiction module component (TIGR02574 family)